MKISRKLTFATLGALGLGLVSTTALTAPSAGWCDGMGYGPGMGGGKGERAQMMQARWTERMDALKAKLKLNADQESLWNNFTAAQRTQHEAMASHWQQMRQAKTNTVERFQNQTQFMEERLAGMKAVTKAAEDLYASLSPEQKTIMDDFFADFPRHMRNRNP